MIHWIEEVTGNSQVAVVRNGELDHICLLEDGISSEFIMKFVNAFRWDATLLDQ